MRARDSLTTWDCQTCFGRGNYKETIRNRDGEVWAFAIKRCTCIAGMLFGHGRLSNWEIP